MSSSALRAWGTFHLVLTFLLLAPWKLFLLLTGSGFELLTGMLWEVIPLKMSEAQEKNVAFYTAVSVWLSAWVAPLFPVGLFQYGTVGQPLNFSL